MEKSTLRRIWQAWEEFLEAAKKLPEWGKLIDALEEAFWEEVDAIKLVESFAVREGALVRLKWIERGREEMGDGAMEVVGPRINPEEVTE